jgi:hypothetical protein
VGHSLLSFLLVTKDPGHQRGFIAICKVQDQTRAWLAALRLGNTRSKTLWHERVLFALGERQNQTLVFVHPHFPVTTLSASTRV